MSAGDVLIESVEDLDCRVEDYAWDFTNARAHEIDLHWRKSILARPQMFNGRVLLMHQADVVNEGGKRILRSKHFETDFAAFMAWRDFGFPDASVRNCFAMAALRGADGGFVLAEMGPHTSNAGEIYFPAGTPDPDDVRDGGLDFAASVARELREETGLTADEVTFDPGWTLAHAGSRLGCLKLVRVDRPADAIARVIDERIARQAQPELARIHVVKDRADIVEAMPPFIAAYLNHML